ncbi:uroporphyrinogen-III synthase [Sporosarcina sp. BI001-red]|uniref:uroporphyrinogen-III synthase n=1 Tax=Sporosarcina sp. BI001-red TaxID=2282866 RepID=UPI000E2696C4|nr:uroporphyrinogen-III synthase [Sporosarcina sp. BI001-red]REB07154.1 uroporphyrinogen-III synthase [Sporosarcina sp. BI001-red]
MVNKLPLEGETVIFTSTKKSDEPYELVKQLGGTPVSYPLIRTDERVSAEEHKCLVNAQAYDWLIFTSQSAVTAFQQKLMRYGMNAEDFTLNVAAVGDRTAQALERIGFQVDFIPEVFSADVFVKQFNPEGDSLHALFIKGNLAGTLISTELSLTVDEWTVYETLPEISSADRIVKLVKDKASVSILFASPSAVTVFTERVAPEIGWTGFTIGAIGHITERALREIGAPVHAMPETYTLPELVRTLAESKGRN